MENRRPIDATFPLLHVGELVPERRDALGGERAGQLLHERMAHTGAGAVREDVEAPGLLWPSQDHFSFSASRASTACRSGFSSSTRVNGASRSPFCPLVLQKLGSPISSHSSCTAFASVTTSSNGAVFGSRSMMLQSGCCGFAIRDAQRWSGMVPRLITYKSVSTSSQMKKSMSRPPSSLHTRAVLTQAGT